MNRQDIQLIDCLYSNPTTLVAVYSGVLQSCHTPVAIKIQSYVNLPSANSSIQEAMIQSSLDHPNIVKVFGCFVEQAESGEFLSYIISERMHSDLAKEITRRQNEHRPWTDSELKTIVVGLVAALSYAERRGISHRDLKPSNLFLGLDETTVKIGDFGSADRMLSGFHSLKSLAGTPLYLSPELKLAFAQQMSGLEVNLEVNPFLSDVYSLGLTIVALGSLRTPIEFANLQDWQQAITRAIGGLWEYPSIKGVVQEMLANLPESRTSFPKLEQRLVPPPVELPQPAGFPNCYKCGRPVSDKKWLSSASAQMQQICIFLDICSIKCLNEVADQTMIDELTKCVQCYSTIRFYNHSPVGLICGHMFHNHKCFYLFLQKSTSNFTEEVQYKCPKCSAEITVEYAESVLKQKLFAFISEYMKQCQNCKSVAPVVKRECKHQLCGRCNSSSEERKECLVCEAAALEKSSKKGSWGFESFSNLKWFR